MIVVIPILVFFSALLLVEAFGNSHLKDMEARLQKYGYGMTVTREGELSRPFSQRVIVPIFAGFSKLALALTPAKVKEATAAKLIKAGNPYSLTASQFLTVAAAAGFILPALYIGMLRSANGSIGFNEILVALLLMAVVTYLGPRIWLNSRISGRQNRIERSLPDALDLITVSVEAGLTLEAALATVVAKTKGPLAEEFEKGLHEMNIGKSRAKALRDIGNRTGVADLKSVIAALVQAEEMGSSISNVLRIQSDSVRVKRQLRAKEQAMQAPVKMLFPLVLFILPAMFIVILGPAVMRLMAAFAGMGR